ncbi:hypothetical protein DEI81_00075 [Curtobacterium sp. MCBD17_013]|nr:hypothetical protein DEI81_00075 [Curtobacterium sp. MCBD17_013]
MTDTSLSCQRFPGHLVVPPRSTSHDRDDGWLTTTSTSYNRKGITVHKKSFLAVLAAAGLVAVSALGFSGPANAAGRSCANKIVDPAAPVVTLWAWSPTASVAVDQFNKAHKDVQICWTNAGAGSAEYDKFSTAIAAKKGAPDVIMLETEQLPSFEIKNALVDLSKYGANKVKRQFSAGTLKDISQNGDIYAIPDDGGPVAMMYNKQIFDKYDLTVPKTWAEYQSAAEKLKAAGGPAFGDWPSDTPAFTQAMFNQAAGSTAKQSFSYNIKNKAALGVKINSAANKKVLRYWSNLVDKGLITTVGQQTTDFTTKLSKNQLATMIAPSWEPGHLGTFGIPTGDDAPWRLAPLPQWSANKSVQVNWGGSTYAVTSQSKTPKLAAEVAIKLFGNENQTTIGAHFPMHLKAQKADWFVNASDPFFGGQKSNRDVWIPAAKGYKGTVYSPFQNYYYTQLQSQLTKTNSGSSTSKALNSLQATITKYATSQDFSLKK